MKIQCENCGTQHELDPPSWVVSSGRAFRFRCSACGHSQSVQPELAARDLGTVAAPTEVPASRAMAPSNPNRPPEDFEARRPDASNPTLAPVSDQRGAASAAADALANSRGPGRPLGSVPPPALLDSDPPAARRASPLPAPPLPRPPIPGAAPSPDTPPRVVTGSAPRPVPPIGAPTAPAVAEQAVYLKQNGQIYRVQDWETLRRWIDEGRVDQNDLVSEGGVRWEPIGSRRDLVPLARPPAVSSPPPVAAPFPFGADAPFAGGSVHDAVWTDDDTEGVPTGLPPLPTEESVALDHPHPPALPDDHDDDALRPPSVPPVELPDATTEGPEARVRSGAIDVIPPVLAALQLSPSPARQDDLEAIPTEGATPAPTERAEQPVTRAPEPELAPLDHRPAAPTPPPVAPSFPGQAGPTKASGWEDLMAPETDEASRPVVPVPVPSLGTPAPASDRHRRSNEPVPTVPPAGAAGAGAFDAAWDDEAENTTSAARWWPLAAAGTLVAVAAVALTVFLWPSPTAVVPEPLPQPAPVEVQPMPAPEPSPEPAPVEAAPVTPAPDPHVEAPGPVAPQPRVEVPAPPPPVPPPHTPAPAPVVPRPQPEVHSTVPPRPVEPAPAPAPAPEPSGGSASVLAQKGWSMADQRPGDAQKLFRQALDLDPSSEEAAYGFGYTLVLQGRVAEGTPWLCRVRNSRNAETRQDANGIIAARQISCP